MATRTKSKRVGQEAETPRSVNRVDDAGTPKKGAYDVKKRRKTAYPRRVDVEAMDSALAAIDAMLWNPTMSCVGPSAPSSASSLSSSPSASARPQTSSSSSSTPDAAGAVPTQLTLVAVKQEPPSKEEEDPMMASSKMAKQDRKESPAKPKVKDPSVPPPVIVNIAMKTSGPSSAVVCSSPLMSLSSLSLNDPSFAKPSSKRTAKELPAVPSKAKSKGPSVPAAVRIDNAKNLHLLSSSSESSSGGHGSSPMISLSPLSLSDRSEATEAEPSEWGKRWLKRELETVPVQRAYFSRYSTKAAVMHRLPSPEAPPAVPPVASPVNRGTKSLEPTKFEMLAILRQANNATQVQSLLPLIYPTLCFCDPADIQVVINAVRSYGVHAPELYSAVVARFVASRASLSASEIRLYAEMLYYAKVQDVGFVQSLGEECMVRIQRNPTNVAVGSLIATMSACFVAHQHYCDKEAVRSMVQWMKGVSVEDIPVEAAGKLAMCFSNSGVIEYSCFEKLHDRIGPTLPYYEPSVICDYMFAYVTAGMEGILLQKKSQSATDPVMQVANGLLVLDLTHLLQFAWILHRLKRADPQIHVSLEHRLIHLLTTSGLPPLEAGLSRLLTDVCCDVYPVDLVGAIDSILASKETTTGIWFSVRQLQSLATRVQDQTPSRPQYLLYLVHQLAAQEHAILHLVDGQAAEILTLLASRHTVYAYRPSVGAAVASKSVMAQLAERCAHDVKQHTGYQLIQLAEVCVTLQLQFNVPRFQPLHRAITEAMTGLVFDFHEQGLCTFLMYYTQLEVPCPPELAKALCAQSLRILSFTPSNLTRCVVAQAALLPPSWAEGRVVLRHLANQALQRMPRRPTVAMTSEASTTSSDYLSISQQVTLLSAFAQLRFRPVAFAQAVVHSVGNAEEPASRIGVREALQLVYSLASLLLHVPDHSVCATCPSIPQQTGLAPGEDEHQHVVRGTGALMTLLAVEVFMPNVHTMKLASLAQLLWAYAVFHYHMAPLAVTAPSLPDSSLSTPLLDAELSVELARILPRALVGGDNAFFYRIRRQIEEHGVGLTAEVAAHLDMFDMWALQYRVLGDCKVDANTRSVFRPDLARLIRMLLPTSAPAVSPPPSSVIAASLLYLLHDHYRVGPILQKRFLQNRVPVDVLHNRHVWILCDPAKLCDEGQSPYGTVTGSVKLQSEYLSGLGYRVMYVNAGRLEADHKRMEIVRTQRDKVTLEAVLSCYTFQLSPRGVAMPCSIDAFLADSLPASSSALPSPRRLAA